MKYVEILYEDLTDEGLRTFFWDLSRDVASDPPASMGLTLGGVRYRVWRDKKARDNSELREQIHLMDRAKGADIPQ